MVLNYRTDENELEKDWILPFIPFEPADRFFDPSSADLTSRTLEFLGNYTAIDLAHPIIQKGTDWLFRNQELNGSWFGRWGITYIYGTWAAVTGMLAVGVNSDHPSLRKAVTWLEGIQNDDGGWGESCYSDIVDEYVPLGASTPSQSAWAIDALLSVHRQPTSSIQKGIAYLLKSRKQMDWTTTYPTGAGLPGIFYIRYHSYNYVWPLLTLTRFLRHSDE
jgi:sporulenol synthase